MSNAQITIRSPHTPYTPGQPYCDQHQRAVTAVSPLRSYTLPIAHRDPADLASPLAVSNATVFSSAFSQHKKSDDFEDFDALPSRSYSALDEDEATLMGMPSRRMDSYMTPKPVPALSDAFHIQERKDGYEHTSPRECGHGGLGDICLGTLAMPGSAWHTTCSPMQQKSAVWIFNSAVRRPFTAEATLASSRSPTAALSLALKNAQQVRAGGKPFVLGAWSGCSKSSW